MVGIRCKQCGWVHDDYDCTPTTAGPLVDEQQSGGNGSLIGVPYDPDDDRFARLLDSQWEAGRKCGWNQYFAHQGLS
ncbi:hypothetical protein [Shinella sp.]|uniref:hypothetical protein n=1 Tax=Shinella sp. TaxID=1870904 RepID=UPI0028A28C4D|nr:hypothetical protein [Shinella sp.]